VAHAIPLRDDAAPSPHRTAAIIAGFTFTSNFTTVAQAKSAEISGRTRNRAAAISILTLRPEVKAANCAAAASHPLQTDEAAGTE
jgi:hypothetical protein